MLLKTIRWSDGGIITSIDVHYLEDLSNINHPSIFDGHRMGLNTSDYLAFKQIKGDLSKCIKIKDKCQRVAENYFDLMADSNTFDL